MSCHNNSTARTFVSWLRSPVERRSAATLGADAHGVVHDHIGEEDFAEAGAAGHLAQGADINARGVHRDEEHGQPPVLGRLPIRAYQRKAEISERAVGRPNLLSIDVPSVSAALGTRSHSSEVGACLWFAEELAGDDVTTPDASRVAGHLLVGAEVGDGVPDGAQPDADGVHVRYLERALDRPVQAFIGGGKATAAESCGTGDPAVSGGPAFALPLLGGAGFLALLLT
jgi:hypothetical protein